MSGQGGFGLSFKLNGTVIVGIEDVDELTFTKFIAEVTAHDSPDGYYEAVATGKFRIQPLNCAMFWDISEATHIAVLAAFDAEAASQFEWADPDGDETVTFNAIVESIGRITAQEDAYRANVAIHPTGTATIV